LVTSRSQVVWIGLQNGNYMAAIPVSAYVSRGTTFLKTAAVQFIDIIDLQCFLVKVEFQRK